MRSTTRLLLALSAALLPICSAFGESAALSTSSVSDWQELRAKLRERRVEMQKASTTTSSTQYSQFKGKYLRPEYGSMYRSFIKLNPRTGLLECEGRVLRPFFTIYSQPKAGDQKWIINIPEFDYDLLEKDFVRMKQAGINVQPRFWNWSELLNYDGTWKRVEKQPKGRGLPYFKFVYEIYDYFLDRAQSHGLYVNIEPSYYWGLHPEVVPPDYRGKILLHPELWDAAREAYAKILGYYSKRTCIIAVMVGEEDLVFDHSLDDPSMLETFRNYLKKTYGTIYGLKQAWRYGYDYEDHSKWKRKTVEGREVISPDYTFAQGRFAKWRSFDDITLPIWDHYRTADMGNNPIQDMPTYQRNLLQDPVWIDFMQMKEDIILSRLNDLADAWRRADSNHVFYYSNAYDFNPAWHFLHCFDRGKLRFDVIGVGQHDSGFDPQDVPQWATCREYIQNVASYGPYLGAGGDYPRAFACGEGEGGKTREGAAGYYPWWLTDIVGGGGAFFQSYHWNHIAGRTLENPTAYDAATLDSIGNFLSQIRHAPFTYNRSAEVLILRNKHCAYGMSAGYDYANTRYLASILHQLHIPFDILPDSDITPGSFERGKVNLGKYRFIFVPSQSQLLPSRTWQMLEDWISDPRFVTKRGLCFGLCNDQDPYFVPTKAADIHPAFAKLTGVKEYSRRIDASGKVRFRYNRFFGGSAHGDQLELEFPANAEIGCFDKVDAPLESLLAMEDGGSSVVIRNYINGNVIYTCGFNLGMAYDPISGAEKEQQPYNLLNPIYLGMLKSVGLEQPISAPDNLGVYISDDRSIILMKERFGKPTDVNLSAESISGVVYAGTTAEIGADGTTETRGFSIEPYGTKVLRKVAVLRCPGASAVCKPTAEGGLECDLSGSGKINVTFEMRPRTIYSVRENGELSLVFTADKLGRQSMIINLGDGKKPRHISVKPSRR